MIGTKHDRVWEAYSRTKDPELKNEIISDYLGLVKVIAKRMNIYFNHHVELGDLVGYGIIGLIDTIDKYDPKKDVKFETYASLRIRGAILDEIRRLDWAPRSLRKKQKDVNRAYEDLENVLGRIPNDEEIAAYLGVTLKAYQQLVQQMSRSVMVFIEDYKIQVDALVDEVERTPEGHMYKQELMTFLAHAIEQLPERERTVIRLYYFEELTLKQISDILNVSESRISQLHTKGVSRLKQKLTQQ